MSTVELLNEIRSLALTARFTVVIDGQRYVLDNPSVELVYQDGLLKRIVLRSGGTAVYRDFLYSDGLLVGITEWRVLE